MLQALVALLVPLAVWRVIVSHRRQPERLAGGRIATGFFAWTLVGVGVLASAFTALGPLVALPITAVLVWLAAEVCPDLRGIAGVAAGFGAGFLYFAVVVLTGSGWSVSDTAAWVVGVVGGGLVVAAVAMSLLVARHAMKVSAPPRG